MPFAKTRTTPGCARAVHPEPELRVTTDDDERETKTGVEKRHAGREIRHPPNASSFAIRSMVLVGKAPGGRVSDTIDLVIRGSELNTKGTARSEREEEPKRAPPHSRQSERRAVDGVSWLLVLEAFGPVDRALRHWLAIIT